MMVHVLRSMKSIVIAQILWLGALIVPAAAHPHLFIDVMAKFLLTDSTLTGVNVFWDLDEMTSSGLIEEFDLNHNNRFEKEEYNKLEREAFSYAAQTNFFTVFTWGKKMLQITTVKHFIAAVQPDFKIRYSFFIPCDLKLNDIAGEKIVMFFSDPSMFVAFELNKKMIQVSWNDKWAVTVTFEKEGFNELIVLNVQRKSE